MALTTLPGSTTSSTATPDKMIRVGVNAQAVIYTCPVGRKLIGQAVVGSQTSSYIYMLPGAASSEAAIQGGSSGGHSWDIYLAEGDVVRGAYAGISGIESDA